MSNEWEKVGKGKKKKNRKGAEGSGEPRSSQQQKRFGKHEMSRRQICFTHTELLELLRKDRIDLVKKLSHQIKVFQATLESSCAKEMNVILGILAKVTECLSCKEDVKADAIVVLSEIFSTRSPIFQSHLKRYISNLPMRSEFKESELILICNFFLELLRIIPGTCWTILPLNELSETITILSKSSCLKEKGNIEIKLKSLLELRDAMGEQHKVDNSRKNIREANSDILPPWENFEYRYIPIMPQLNEVSESKPKLRKSIIEGEYDDWMHYYDVQFRLLREDFIAPLRKGIQEYREGKRGREVSNVRIYDNVCIKEPHFTKAGLCHAIQCDKERFKRTNWEHSSRLMFGSLLCLSSDHFTSQVIFATVSNRDPRELIKGKVQVMFQESTDVILHRHLGTPFVMVESIAFFEGSRHILRSLQLAEELTMPFSKYLIKNSTECVGPPKYLEAFSEGVAYNLSFIIKKEVLRNPRLAKKYTCVDIKKSSEWPPLEDTGLDKSQLKAMKMALTQEVAVIQGPPGTGKTFIGLKIVQALLTNNFFWSNSNLKQCSSGPILVMCFTNHALDQFLEGIINLDDTDKIRLIRIGSRSKNEVIQNCSLHKVMQNKKLVPWEEHQKFIDRANEAEIIGKECHYELSRYSDPVHDFFYFNEIKSVISEHHIQSLLDIANSQEEINLALELWLGLYVKKEYLEVEHFKENFFNLEEVSSDDSSEEEDYSDDEYDTANSSFDEGEEELAQQEEEHDKNHELQARLIEGFEELYKDIEMKETAVVKTNKPKRLHNMRRTVKLEKCNDYSTFFQTKTQDLSESIYGDYEAEIIEDLHSLHLDDRWELYKYWHIKYRKKVLEDLEEKWRNYNEACEEANAAWKNKEKFALESAHVVGMTTTGAARYQSVLHKVKPKIVIVEEAAEVLESHIVSALNAGTQHLILIGDHKQLRPKPNDYNLAQNYNLEISLFERLVINNFPHVTLNIQHRMRPEIAELVHPLIYDTLYNHEDVLKYSVINGVSKNMFFINHNHDEHSTSDRSHANEFESKYLMALCMYLIKQGYKPSQITILVTYTGQLLLVKSAIKSRQGYYGVRVCTVDNFQGEENDIILLSLVRSNPKGEIGFLNKDNRVCVALSRAKCSFFCIGNFTMLRKKSLTWERIISDMQIKGKFGSSLELQCSIHKDEVKQARTVEDFLDTVCSKDCGKRMICGHACVKKCHKDDPMHKIIKCKKMVVIECPFKHKIQCMCHEAHRTIPPNCKEMVEKECPQCGHKKIICCPQEFLCKAKVEKIIPRCNHTQLVPCYIKPEQFQCTKMVEKNIPTCNHLQNLMCHINPLYAKCLTKVEKHLKCGHFQEVECHIKVWRVRCHSRCGKLCARDLHPCSEPCHYGRKCAECNVRIEETFPQCGHKQEIFCHEDVREVKCHNKCAVLCAQGHPCPLECHEQCQSCRVPVDFTPACGHGITVICFEVEKYVCTKQVEKKLICGHAKKLPCSKDVKGVKCSTPVELTLLKCKHTLRVECNKLNDISKIRCIQEVEKYLACGNHCKKVACFVDIGTILCREEITVTLPCDHERVIPCHKDVNTVICDVLCKRLLSCDHTKELPCHEVPNAENCTELCSKTRNCGHSITVACNKNPDTVSCHHVCGKCLSCGHNCQMTCSQKCACHQIIDVKLLCGHHKSVNCRLSQDQSKLMCTRSCQKKLPCGHPCTKMCYERCTEACRVMVNVTCGEGVHQQKLACFKTGQLQRCQKKCQKRLPCNHVCQELCGSECTHQCQEIVLSRYPCGHSHKVPCFTSPESRPCDIQCKHPLTCGHLCNGRCSDCYTTRIHKPCTSSNRLRHFCGELTRLPCLGIKSKHTKSDAGKFEGIKIGCHHSKHLWKCYNSMPKCQARCDWYCPPQCPHPKKCTKTCSELCDRAPCNERCLKMLSCQLHHCVGLCGEPCINICPHCDSEKFARMLQLSSSYCEKQLYVQLPCGHIFVNEDMDKYVHQKSAESEVCPLQCPSCFTPLSCSYRYGNDMKKSLLDIAAVKISIGDRNQSKRIQLFEMYNEAKTDSQMDYMKTECPELYKSFAIIVRKFTDLNPEKEFMMFLFVKIFQFAQQINLSAVAKSVIENLRVWLHSQMDSPKLSFQVIYDLLSEYYRICLEILTEGQSKLALPMKFIDKLKNPHFRISTWEFQQLSQTLNKHFAAAIMAGVEMFQPHISNGTWMRCRANHFYCIPTTRTKFQYLKSECFVCSSSSYSTSIVVELPQDIRAISDQFVDISSEREKVIIEGKKKNKRGRKGFIAISDVSEERKIRRKPKSKKKRTKKK